MVLYIVQNLAGSFAACFAFAVLCRVPKGALVKAGLIGMAGWMVYTTVLQAWGGIFLASMLCCLALALLGLMAGIKDKQPLTVYLVPGLVPVVPGITFSMAFSHMLQGEYALAGRVLLDVLYSSVGLVCGLAIAVAAFRAVTRVRAYK